ncbi:FliM/FliN family flagellar motor switch protein [Ramlibacter tataouinensis]|uniref:FliM/FliN family flagellar motor switch protein n=1 Tax=Ramlibacter tataouinensis TaxID=94132 RepID=UPI0011AE4BA6|nr:FliM/FliN family flagellar motor C-terminal domain-containing protein [Ramlibacter tataouinensis]
MNNDKSAGRPLMWWTDSQLNDVAGRVRLAWAQWAAEWACETRGGDRVVAAPAHESNVEEEPQWLPLGSHGDGGAWIAPAGHPQQGVRSLLFGREPATRETIADVVACRAWDELLGRLRSGLRQQDALDASPPDAHLHRPWSGAVVVTFGGQASWRLLLEAACVGAVAAPLPTAERGATHRPALVPMQQAIAPHPLPLCVEITGCDLDLGSLAGLRVGDILPLPHPLDRPLMVSMTGGTPLCNGFLGRQGSLKAIELAPAHAAEPH